MIVVSLRLKTDAITLNISFTFITSLTFYAQVPYRIFAKDPSETSKIVQRIKEIKAVP